MRSIARIVLLALLLNVSGCVAMPIEWNGKLRSYPSTVRAADGSVGVGTETVTTREYLVIGLFPYTYARVFQKPPEDEAFQNVGTSPPTLAVNVGSVLLTAATLGVATVGSWFLEAAEDHQPEPHFSCALQFVGYCKIAFRQY